MTCIVALKENGTIWMGADSCAGNSADVFNCVKPKVFKNGEFLIGYTSSFRMGQLLQYSLNLPKHRSDISLTEYMVTLFADSLRECFKKAGFAQKNDEKESGGIFLVGYKENLFKIQSDYSVLEPLSDFTSCGCGEDFAMGALYATHKEEPEKRITVALEAAAKFNPFVSEPFKIESLSHTKKKEQ